MPQVEPTDGMPWWLGAIALATIVVGYAFMMRRSLGVSGAIACAISPPARRDDADDADDGNASEDDDAELLAATLAAFGADAVREAAQVAPPPMPATPASAPALTWGPQVIFLVFLVVGGLLSRFLPGAPPGVSSMAPEFARWFGTGPFAIAVLVVGGLLVGFGTQMSGGCTTGHGLTGTARLQPGSVVSTAAFFGTGIAVSFLLHAWFG